MNSLKDIASWGALIGAVMPFLIAVVQQPEWSARQRQVISLVVSVIAGVGVVIAGGKFDPQNWLVTIVTVIGAAQVSYVALKGATDKVERSTLTTKKKNQYGYITLNAYADALVLAFGMLVLALIIARIHWLMFWHM